MPRYYDNDRFDNLYHDSHVNFDIDKYEYHDQDNDNYPFDHYYNYPRVYVNPDYDKNVTWDYYPGDNRIRIYYRGQYHYYNYAGNNEYTHDNICCPCRYYKNDTALD